MNLKLVFLSINFNGLPEEPLTLYPIRYNVRFLLNKSAVFFCGNLREEKRGQKILPQFCGTGTLSPLKNKILKIGLINNFGCGIGVGV